MSRPPRLRGDLVIVEQVYRDETSYIVKDPETHKYYRFRPVEVLVMQEFDGRSTTEVAAALAQQGLAFSTAAVDRFARKLGDMGLLERTLAQKSVLLLERLRAQRRRRLRGGPSEGSLLRLRWSVGDPDRLLDRWLPRVRFCFQRPFLLFSVGLFLVYAVIAVLRWPQLSAAIVALYTPSHYTLGNFLLLYATAIVIVTIHEFGHGFTCKHFGGHVHEMGAMLIYLQPAFYCNVNDAWTFPELRARLWVTAAGSWIQLVVAALAAVVWWLAAPGTLISQVTGYAVVVGGATTILANANPLIPLDGYYALSDWLEIPNLRQRAFQYLGWLLKHRVLRLETPEPDGDEREKRVFLVYGLLAVLYSTMILVVVFGAVLGWVNRTLGGLGALALLLLAWTALRSQLRNGARTLLTVVREHRRTWLAPGRRRRILATAGVVLVLGFVPWPISVRGQFTAAPALELVVRSPEDAAVVEILAPEGAAVPAGTPLARLRNFALERAAISASRFADSLATLAARARAAGDALALRRFEAQQAEWTAQHAGLDARLQALVLRAPVTAAVLTARPLELVGRTVGRGDTVLRLGVRDSLDVRVRLVGPGATLAAPGQRASLVSYGAVGRAVAARVSAVSAAVAGAVEVRFHVPADVAVWRPGAQGEAKVTVRRSTLWGALWWAVRKRIRNDVLL